MAPRLANRTSRRAPLNLRTTEELRTKLEEAAKKEGRNLTQEIERRIEQSFEWERAFEGLELLTEQKAIDCLVQAGWPSVPGTQYGLVFAQPGSYARIGKSQAAEVLRSPPNMNVFRLGPAFELLSDEPPAPAPVPAPQAQAGSGGQVPRAAPTPSAPLDEQSVYRAVTQALRANLSPRLLAGGEPNPAPEDEPEA